MNIFLVTGRGTKTDGFSEKFQTASTNPPSAHKIPFIHIFLILNAHWFHVFLTQKRIHVLSKHTDFHDFFVLLVTLFVGLLQSKFWCQWPSTYLIWTVTPLVFRDTPKSLASFSSETEEMPICVPSNGCFRCLLEEIHFPGQMASLPVAVQNICQWCKFLEKKNLFSYTDIWSLFV